MGHVSDWPSDRDGGEPGGGASLRVIVEVIVDVIVSALAVAVAVGALAVVAAGSPARSAVGAPVALVAVSAPVPPGGAVGASSRAGCPWLAPVEAAVVDGFRPPSHPYGPGNLGLEYGVVDGQEVRAVAGGQVGFVGPVGGRRYVVVGHPNGLRSTYGPMAVTGVARGQRVGAGDRLGAAAPGLHLTARLGDRYLDPGPLLAGRCGRLRLLPDGPGGERAHAG